MRTKATIMATALALALATLPVGISHADDGALEQLIPQLASTPEQHKAVASYYRSLAASASAEAARHRDMGNSYAQGNYTRRKIMKEHCDKLAATYNDVAKQYQDLAADHEQLASGQ